MSLFLKHGMVVARMKWWFLGKIAHTSSCSLMLTHLSEAFVCSKRDFTQRTGTWVWWLALEMRRRENQELKANLGHTHRPNKQNQKNDLNYRCLN